MRRVLSEDRKDAGNFQRLQLDSVGAWVMVLGWRFNRQGTSPMVRGPGSDLLRVDRGKTSGNIVGSGWRPKNSLGRTQCSILHSHALNMLLKFRLNLSSKTGKLLVRRTVARVGLLYILFGLVGRLLLLLQIIR